jgi:hypothetical protein
LHPAKEAIFNAGDGWVSDTTFEGDLTRRRGENCLRSISMKCGIVLGVIGGVKAALRNNDFATTEEPRIK